MFTLTPGTPVPHSVFLFMIVPALRHCPQATNTRNTLRTLEEKLVCETGKLVSSRRRNCIVGGSKVITHFCEGLVIHQNVHFLAKDHACVIWAHCCFSLHDAKSSLP